eukprot:75110-Heterocapsa_arctica.AAC.1
MRCKEEKTKFTHSKQRQDGQAHNNPVRRQQQGRTYIQNALLDYHGHRNDSTEGATAKQMEQRARASKYLKRKTAAHR